VLDAIHEADVGADEGQQVCAVGPGMDAEVRTNLTERLTDVLPPVHRDAIIGASSTLGSVTETPHALSIGTHNLVGPYLTPPTVSM
jgi:hypothetical protein